MNTLSILKTDYPRPNPHDTESEALTKLAQLQRHATPPSASSATTTSEPAPRSAEVALAASLSLHEQLRKLAADPEVQANLAAMGLALVEREEQALGLRDQSEDREQPHFIVLYRERGGGYLSGWWVYRAHDMRPFDGPHTAKHATELAVRREAEWNTGMWRA